MQQLEAASQRRQARDVWRSKYQRDTFWRHRRCKFWERKKKPDSIDRLFQSLRNEAECADILYIQLFTWSVYLISLDYCHVVKGRGGAAWHSKSLTSELDLPFPQPVPRRDNVEPHAIEIGTAAHVSELKPSCVPRCRPAHPIIITARLLCLAVLTQ